MSEYEHIHPDFKHVMHLSDKDRIQFMDQPRWVGYPIAQSTIDLLQNLMIKPTRPRMPNVLLVGEPNQGKTTIVRRFFELCGKGYVDENMEAIKPVIIAESPPSADEKSLYLSILQQFHAPHRPTDPVSKLRYQVIHLFRACSVRMLIIDEFHSLLTGSTVKQREVMNAIKFMCNELAIPIVGVGTREAVRVLHTDPQHASRFEVSTLPTWQLDADFQKLLANFEAILPLKKVSKLYKPELAQVIHSISDGNLGNLTRLLVECGTEAIKNGDEIITLKTINKFAWIRPTQGIRERIG